MSELLQVVVVNRQRLVAVDLELIRAEAVRILGELNVRQAEISIAFVDNPAMAEFNWRFLQHEGPTDIITFPLSSPDDERLEGELIISAPWAAEVAGTHGDRVEDELVLYVAHGLLHLVGQDDIAPEDARRMRQRELGLLRALGRPVPANRFEEISEEEAG